MNRLEKFSLFPDCIPVKGISRSAIYDLGRNEVSLIPNGLYDILTSSKVIFTQKLKTTYPDEIETLNEYLDFLITKEFIYDTDLNIPFNDLEISFKTPSLINNIIIDIDELSEHNFTNISESINLIGCKSLLLRFYFTISPKQLEYILKHFADSCLKDIVIILPIEVHTYIYKMIRDFKQLSEVILYSGTENKREIYQSVIINTITSPISDEKHCGIIRKEHFRVNIQLFMESKLYNNCLNKKVSIDKKGFIMNCPAMKKKFGNIHSDSIFEIVQKEEFQIYWKIRKDEIQKCNVCEFRYMCTDCRAFVENEHEILSAPSKCNYNPYTNKWSV